MPRQERDRAALVRAQLRGEKTRALIVLAVFGSLGVVGTVALGIFGDVLGRLTGDPGTVGVLLVALVAFLAFEGLMVVAFARAERTATPPPRTLLVGSTVIEALAPSILIWALSSLIPGGQAVDAPPLLIYFVLIILSTLRLDPGLSVLTGVVAGVGYLGVGLLNMPAAAGLDPVRLNADPLPHVARAVVMVVSGLLAAFVSGEIIRRQRLADTLRSEREKVINVFGQHVSPEVVDTVLADDAELTTEVRFVCVMFLDIRSFTAFSETRAPDEVVDVLNRLFEPLVDVVGRHRGVINKFLGDGFMAVFGAPLADGREREHAIRAGIELVETVDRLRERDVIPDVDIGIALHAGEATTGTVGSRRRKEYTVIGDVVNVASRIEGLNTRFGSRLLVSSEVWEPVADRFAELRPEAMEPVRVKGRAEPVVCVRLVRTRGHTGAS